MTAPRPTAPAVRPALSREQWQRMSPQQRAAYARRVRALREQVHQRAPQQSAAPDATRPAVRRRRPMTRRTALSIVVLGALLVGGIAAAVVAKAMSPVLAFADSTQAQAMQTHPPAPQGKPQTKPQRTLQTAQTPKAAANHCASNRAGQLVLVDLRSQHAWFCAGHRTVYSTPITSGKAAAATSTPTGHFTIRAKARDTVLSPDTGEHYAVQYWLPFKGDAYGFHDASWQTIPFGSAQYATHGSHGCVHLPLLAVRYLYSWVHVGASVSIT